MGSVTHPRGFNWVIPSTKSPDCISIQRLVSGSWEGKQKSHCKGAEGRGPPLALPWLSSWVKPAVTTFLLLLLLSSSSCKNAEGIY